MTDETLEAFIRQYIDASPGPEVSFVWHGGEPTLAGLDFYRRVVELQAKHVPAGYQCWNNLQTNGVLLNDEWCQFLAENKFDVGLSIDGTQLIHDEYRQDVRGQGSYQGAADAIRRLQAHGVHPDLLCTVTSTVARQALAVYRNLRSFETGWIEFIPIIRWGPDGQLTPDSVTADAYGAFLCTVLDEWAIHDLGRLNVQVIAETMRVLAGGQAGLCWMAPTCGRALIVEADGGVYSCDHYVRQEHRLGVIDASGDLAGACQTTLGAMADSPQQVKFGLDKRDALPYKCRICPYLRLCNGGCPKDRQADGVNVLCSGLQRYFGHAIPMLTAVIEGARAGDDPISIMAHLRAMALEAWQGIGRNDPCPCGSGRKAKQCCWTSRPS